MKGYPRLPVLLCAVALLSIPGRSNAQQPVARMDSTRMMGSDTLPADTLRWYVNPYVGAFWINDDDLADIGMSVDSPRVVFGARLGYRFHPHWAFEGSYGYGTLKAKSTPSGNVDGKLHVYYAALDYLAPADASARVVLTLGAGGMRYSYDPFSRENATGDEVNLIDTSWANEFDLVFGAGFEVDAGRRAAFRFDVRDHLQFCNAETQPINETSDFSHCPLDSRKLSNPEVSGGISIRF